MNTTKIENLLSKIQELRKQRGYSLENMADELNLSHSAYYKLENNQSRLTVERLMEISRILDTSLFELLNEVSEKKYNQKNNVEGGVIITKRELEYFEKDKQLTDKIINVFEEEIKHLKSEIDFLREMMNKK